jgi:hypothetical protein
MLAKDVVIVGVKGNVVLINVSIELISTENFSNFNKLIIIVLALEEGFLLENHA